MYKIKPWLINIIAITIVFFIAFFVPHGRDINIVIFLVSAIWVYIDTKRIQYDKYKMVGFVPGGGPLGVSLTVLFFWIIGFPIYISYRRKIIDGKIPLKNSVAPVSISSTTINK